LTVKDQETSSFLGIDRYGKELWNRSGASSAQS
jgi:hypothetical protein